MTALRLAYPLIAVRDLQAAAERYESIGFSVGPTQRRAGLALRMARLRDNAIALVGIEDPARRGDRLHDIIADRLALREGVALVALQGGALQGGADQTARLRERGVDTAGDVLPDAAHPALGFVLSDLPDAPEPEHPNSSRRILRLTYAAADPASVRPRFRALWGRTTTHPDGFEVATSSGTLRVISNQAVAERYLTADMPQAWDEAPGVAAITLLADSLHSLVQRLYPMHVPHSVYTRKVRVDASFAGNVMLEFVAPVPMPLYE
jgi:hypothetical protein